MWIDFLQAHVSLTKKFTTAGKQSYPNAFEFKSARCNVNDLDEFAKHLKFHAANGSCLLKGQLDRSLEWESRAGRTEPDQPTQWVCLDLDGLASVRDIPAFMYAIGLADVSYVLQWSASYGVHGDFTLRAHVFVFLKQAVAPGTLKLWLKQLNLQHLKSDLALTKTNMSLRWGLDITTCQSDKLIFITPPQCEPVEIDQFRGTRIIHVRHAADVYDFDRVALMSPAQIRQLEEDAINELRKQANLPTRKASQFKLRTLTTGDRETYLPNPDEAVVSGVKQEREFVYLNLNGGDSWAYYHPVDKPEYIRNFKDEPVYKTSELLPAYWQQLVSKQRQAKAAAAKAHVGKQFLAFRDLVTAKYYNGWYDPATDELSLHEATSRDQLADFLEQYGQPVPEFYPVWKVVYDPARPVMDLHAPDVPTVNFFNQSELMRRVAATPSSVQPAPTPTIDRLILHVVGPAMVGQQFNWIAYIYQERTAPGTAWVWHGTQGTGKGMLYHYVLRPIFGMSNTLQKRMEELEDKFNESLGRCLLCMIDEAQISESKRSTMIMANLKSQITEPELSIRAMRTNYYTVPNRMGLIFASNMPDPVTIEEGDRRFNIGDYQPDKLEVTSQMLKDIEAELFDFALRLSRHKVDLDAVRTPRMNDAKQQMIDTARSSADTVARALLTGDLSILWDGLPTVDSSMLDPLTQANLFTYKQLVVDLITTRRTKLSRDELKIIFTYNVGNVPGTSNKFTSYLRHHKITLTNTRIANKIVKGAAFDWAMPDEWYEEKLAEIEAERTGKHLKAVPTFTPTHAPQSNSGPTI